MQTKPSKRIDSYLNICGNNERQRLYHYNHKRGFDECLKFIRCYLFNKYKKLGHDFCFRSVTIKRDTGINATVIGKSLSMILSDKYKGVVFAKPIHRTKSNKRVVWKTCFGVE